MRALSFLIAATLLFLGAAAARAADAVSTWESLFAAEARDVAAARDTRRSAVFGNKLFESAKTVADDKPLQALLCRKAYEYAAVHPDGHAAAIGAMELLASISPADKVDADAKILSIMEQQFRTEKLDKRKALAPALFSQATEVSDALAAKGDYEDSLAVLRRAGPVAELIGPESVADLAARSRIATARVASAKRAAQLRMALRIKPQDAAAASDLALLLLLELDKPADAAAIAPASDEPLQKAAALAAKEVSALSGEELLTLADFFRTHAAKSNDAGKANGLSRALAAYERFLETYTKDDALRLRAKLGAGDTVKQLESSKGLARRRTVNLLPLINPARDAVGGKWTLDKNGLTFTGDGGPQRIKINYQPPDEYDFRIEFTKAEGTGSVLQIFSRPSGGGAVWSMSIGPTPLGLIEQVKGNYATNPTMIRTIDASATGKKYTSVVQVRKDGVTILFDGKPVLRHKTDYKDLAIPAFWAVPSPLAIAAHDSTVLFSAVELLEVSGIGRPLLPASTTATRPR